MLQLAAIRGAIGVSVPQKPELILIAQYAEAVRGLKMNCRCLKEQL